MVWGQKRPCRQKGLNSQKGTDEHRDAGRRTLVRNKTHDRDTAGLPCNPFMIAWAVTKVREFSTDWGSFSSIIMTMNYFYKEEKNPRYLHFEIIITRVNGPIPRNDARGSRTERRREGERFSHQEKQSPGLPK